MSIFRFDRSSFMRGPVQLHIQRGALSQPGGFTGLPNAPYNCFVDFEALAALQKVEVWHGQNLVQRITGEMLYLDYCKSMDIEAQKAAQKLLLGNTPTATRVTYANQTMDMWVDLRRLWFTGNPRRYFLCTATASELELRVYLNPLTSIIQQSANANGAVTCNILQGELVTFDVQVEDDEKKFLLASTETSEGINYKFNDCELQLNSLIPHGTQQAQIQLTNLKGACYALDMLLKINPQGNIQSDATNLDLVPLTGKTGGTHTKNNAYFGAADCGGNTLPAGVNPSGDVYQLAKSWQLVSADVIVWDTTPDIYQRYYIFPFYYRGVTDGSPIYTAVLSMVPTDAGNCSGHKTFSAMINPTVTVNYPGAIPYDQFASFYSHVYNNIQVPSTNPYLLSTILTLSHNSTIRTKFSRSSNDKLGIRIQFIPLEKVAVWGNPGTV